MWFYRLWRHFDYCYDDWNLISIIYSNVSSWGVRNLHWDVLGVCDPQLFKKRWFKQTQSHKQACTVSISAFLVTNSPANKKLFYSFISYHSTIFPYCEVRIYDFNFLLGLKSVVLNLGSIEPLGFDRAVSGVRGRSSEIWLKAWLYHIKLNMVTFVYH